MKSLISYSLIGQWLILGYPVILYSVLTTPENTSIIHAGLAQQISLGIFCISSLLTMIGILLTPDRTIQEKGDDEK